MSNLDLYNRVRKTPDSALKPIQAGRLKGKSDINPMWRIEKLTEEFGPCGIGWRPEIVNFWLEPGANGEVAAFCQINLYVSVLAAQKGQADDNINQEVLDRLSAQWSEPIPGIGGSMFVANEKNGPYVSDECFKMAYTDAISVACKQLGFAADVYWAAGGDSKYKQHPEQQAPPKQSPPKELPATPQAGEKHFFCSVCGVEINQAVATYSAHNYGNHLCREHQKQQKEGA